MIPVTNDERTLVLPFRWCTPSRLIVYDYCMHGHTYSNSMDQPGEVANPARGQLNGENDFLPVRVRA